MHAALFVASVAPETLEWISFLDDVEPKMSRRKGVLRLAENVWMLDLDPAAESLGVLTRGAESHGIAYGVLPLEETPHWLPDGFDPHDVHVRPHASYCV